MRVIARVCARSGTVVFIWDALSIERIVKALVPHPFRSNAWEGGCWTGVEVSIAVPTLTRALRILLSHLEVQSFGSRCYLRLGWTMKQLQMSWTSAWGWGCKGRLGCWCFSTASTSSGTFALLWLFPPAAASLARIFIVDLVLPPACGCCAKVTAPSLDAETFNFMLMAAP